MTTLKVVRGNPTAEELAAALVVLHARATAPTEAAAPDALDLWADTTWRGLDSWRTTYWQR